MGGQDPLRPEREVPSAGGKSGRRREQAQRGGRKHAIAHTTHTRAHTRTHTQHTRTHTQNVHTMDELKLTGNHLKGSRPVLSFDGAFDTEPHLQLL